MPGRDLYTRYPRPILWLIPGGTLPGPVAGYGDGGAVEVAPFYLSKLPVTNEQLEAFDPGWERSELAPGDRDPAAGVSWEDAAEYCRWWAEVTRKPIRLPTAAEWEHACRGGEAASGRVEAAWLDEHAWHAGNAPEGRLPALEEKRANGYGVYGMLGGVWEWTAEEGEEGARVLRGGSLLTGADRFVEEGYALRRVEPAETAVADAGFRIVKSLR